MAELRFRVSTFPDLYNLIDGSTPLIWDAVAKGIPPAIEATIGTYPEGWPEDTARSGFAFSARVMFKRKRRRRRRRAIKVSRAKAQRAISSPRILNPRPLPPPEPRMLVENSVGVYAVVQEFNGRQRTGVGPAKRAIDNALPNLIARGRSACYREIANANRGR